jgi:SAM-dependent methyltransferase
MSDVPEIFDQSLLARRIARAMAQGPPADYLLRRVCDDFSDRLCVVNRSFGHAIALGATGAAIADRLRNAPKVGNAAASAEDEEALGLAPQSVDLVGSALTLQLVNDLPGTMAQIARALRPDGLMLAALLGGDTLKELREAWLIAEEETTGGASPRVAPFADVRQLGALLQRAGFQLPVADSDLVTVRYASPLDLMRDLKSWGASNMLVARRREPVTRRLLIRAAEVYQQRFSDADGRVRATFEIITLTGWAAHESQQKPLRPGSASQRLSDVLGVAERSAGETAPKSK